ncbi:MAG: hypothetical protein R6W77_14885 [Trueperaceae bacterium]
MHRKAARASGAWEFGQPKTSKNRRTVDLPQGVVALLSAPPRHYDQVFHNADGAPTNLRCVVSEHNSVLKRAGIDARGASKAEPRISWGGSADPE